jgi:hypothetical protein
MEVNRNMNVVYVSTYVVKYEKQTEFQAMIRKFLKFKKANPKIFEGVKSFRLFQQEYGGVVGSYVEMWEFKSKEEQEKFITGYMKHKELKEIDTEFQKMVDHTTLTSSIWKTVA